MSLGASSTVRSRRLVLLAAAVVLAVALAYAALASQTTSAAGAKTVTIRGFAFKPATLTVSKGTRVTFANRDGAAHTATDPGAFDTGRIRGGGSVSVRFKRKGTFAYHCTLHPSMRGKVVVK